MTLTTLLSVLREIATRVKSPAIRSDSALKRLKEKRPRSMTRPSRPCTFLAGASNARIGMVQGYAKAAPDRIELLEAPELPHYQSIKFQGNANSFQVWAAGLIPHNFENSKFFKRELKTHPSYTCQFRSSYTSLFVGLGRLQVSLIQSLTSVSNSLTPSSVKSSKGLPRLSPATTR